MSIPVNEDAFLSNQDTGMTEVAYYYFRHFLCQGGGQQILASVVGGYACRRLGILSAPGKPAILFIELSICHSSVTHK